MNELYYTLREPVYLIVSSIITWLLARISISQNGSRLIAEAIDYVLVKIFEVDITKLSAAEKFEHVSSQSEKKFTRRQRTVIEERYGTLDNFIQFIYDKYASPTLDAKKIKNASKYK